MLTIEDLCSATCLILTVLKAAKVETMQPAGRRASQLASQCGEPAKAEYILCVICYMLCSISYYMVYSTYITSSM